MKKSLNLWILAIILIQACSNEEDAQPTCIAPPSCGQIVPNQVNFTIFNSTTLNVLGYNVVKSASDFESVQISAGELRCWHNFSRTDVSTLEITLGEGEDDQNAFNISLALNQTITIEDGETYWVDVNHRDNSYIASISKYDPTVCNDTVDN
ncbi:hypothetical protein [Roseivirga sp. E12]|uniref:hypothetical protein n=1 Tax=Roseivirga sp. E12 TaxID=2819237 RepID=UPI001ABC76EC|nr:hypothetical protein [Roseivirga sp. E12]MBO3698049.1 hypothetical protein [Roseivirga sp. E12]